MDEYNSTKNGLISLRLCCYKLFALFTSSSLYVPFTKPQGPLPEVEQVLIAGYWTSRMMYRNRPLPLKITEFLPYDPALHHSWVCNQRLKQKHLYIQFIATPLSTAMKWNQPRFLFNEPMNKESVAYRHRGVLFICIEN